MKRRRKPQDFADEIASHLAHEAEQRGEEGAEAGASAAGAERAFGNTVRTQELFWETTRWWPGWLRAVGRDVQLAGRRMRRNPRPTLAAVALLGFGMAAVLVMIAAANVLVFGGPPYPQAERLMRVAASAPGQLGDQISAGDFTDLQERGHSFSAVAGVSPVWDNVADAVGGRPAQRISSLFASATLGPMLGIQPRLGRWFSAAEDRAGTAGAVGVISDRLWRQRFGGDAGAVGKTIRIEGQAVTIVGIMAPEFRYVGEPLAGTATQVDLWLPLSLNPLMSRPRTLRWVNVLAQRRAGVSVAQAQQEVEALGAAWGKQYPAADGGLRYSASSLSEWLRAPHRDAMWMLLGAAGLLLALACASVANLLLEQALARRGEMAMRRALGATRGQLLRQLAVEHFSLAGVGTVVGVVLAWVGLAWLVQMAPRAMFAGRAPTLDGDVLALAAMALVGTAMGCGLAPAWTALQERAAAHTLLTGGLGRVRGGLVAAQIAISFALAVGAGLLLVGFQRITAVSPGFDVEHTVAASTQLPGGATTQAERLSGDLRLLGRLQELPGIEAVGLVSRLPLSGKSLTSEIWPEGKVYAEGRQPEVEYRLASAGYFDAMGIAILTGRGFTPRDDTDPEAASREILVNQEAARRFWPGEAVVGKRVQFGGKPDGRWATIMGVVGNVKSYGLGADARPTVFRPLAYSTLGSPIVVARVQGDRATALREIEGAIHRMDPAMPVYNAAAMADLLTDSLAQRRLLMALLMLFAAVGTLVAGVGVYANMAQSVARRRREFALRIALGARPAQLGGAILGQATAVTAVGLAGGLVLAVGLGRLLRGLLFATSPLAPPVYAWAGVGLATLALLAAVLPARRAACTSPAQALREQ